MAWRIFGLPEIACSVGQNTCIHAGSGAVPARHSLLSPPRATASTPSLRAQRSNPESLRCGILDCFVARAPRNDVWREFALAMTLSPLRRRQRLHDLLERGQRLAARGMCAQCRIARRVEQLRMRLAGEAGDTGDRDFGVADAVTQPVRRRHLGALGFQHSEHVADLRLAALDPQRELLLSQHALIEQADRLVAEAGGERADAQMPATLDA